MDAATAKSRNVRLYPWYALTSNAYFWMPVFVLYFLSEGGRGIALGDFDGDGDKDIFLTNFPYPLSGPNTTWTNNPGRTFTQSAESLGNSKSNGVALGDLDGDGDLDTLVTNSNQPSKVWINSERCSADINADGVVNGEDLTILLADWGESRSKADLNNDGVVNGADLTILLSFWNDCP